MKKTLTVNLNGRVFNIDEDAYNLLDNYIRNLRIYFRKEEGFSEIIADFEGRIEELFSEYIRSGNEVISIEEVENVIQKVGKPEDFGEMDTSSEIFEEKREQEIPKQSFQGEKKIRKRLYRNIDNKLAGGVFSGIAAYFGWDETPVRLGGLIFLIVLTSIYGLGIWSYLILWIIIPPAKTAQQKLEMRGEEVSIENIGKVVSGNIVTENSNNGCLGSILDFFASLLKVILVGLGILIGFPLIFILIIVLIVIFAVLLGVGGGLMALPFGIAGIEFGNITFTNPTLTLIASILVAGIPLLSLIYWIVAHFAKLSPMPKSIKITGIIVWIIALIVLTTSGLQMNWNETGIKWRNNKWRIGWFKSFDHHIIKGNGIITDKTFEIPPFNNLILDEGLIANVRLKQIASNSSKIQINCDSNITEHIKWSVNNNKLKLFTTERTRLESDHDITITISSPTLNRVEIESIGNVKIPGKVETPYFQVEIDGAGNFEADSLFCTEFHGNVEGVGNLKVAGKTTKSNFELKGAGNINAFDFESDEIHAALEGIGKISCNPINSINAKVEGIGKISYKNEPPVKNIRIEGLGSIGK